MSGGRREHEAGVLAYAVARSVNAKIGESATTYAAQTSCPAACPFLDGGGCYAEQGPLGKFHTEPLNQQIQAGDTIVLHKHGARRVVTVERYETVGLGACECFIVVYDTGRSSRASEDFPARPVLQGLARRLRGEPVRVERLEAA